MLTVMSYNVMFNDIHLRERHKKSVELIKNINPDVICLQEVRADWVDFFLDSFGNYHSPFETLMPKGREYGELTLVKSTFSIIHKEVLPLNSLMRRALLLVRISNGADIFNVINFHLESTALAPFRKDQLETMWRVYGKLPNTIFCGDTNLRDDEDDETPSTIKDLWKTIGGPKSTYFANRFWGKKWQQRYDRFYYTTDLEPFSFKGIGYNPFLHEGKDVWISDHDAIVGQFCQ